MAVVAGLPIVAPPADSLSVRHEVLRHPQDGVGHTPELSIAELEVYCTRCGKNHLEIRYYSFYDFKYLKSIK